MDIFLEEKYEKYSKYHNNLLNFNLQVINEYCIQLKKNKY
jgi:hypothetical protein